MIEKTPIRFDNSDIERKPFYTVYDNIQENGNIKVEVTKAHSDESVLLTFWLPTSSKTSKKGYWNIIVSRIEKEFKLKNFKDFYLSHSTGKPN